MKKANKIILGHAFSSKENTTASKLFVMGKKKKKKTPSSRVPFHRKSGVETGERLLQH